VNLPNRGLFSSIEEYYCALFHELTHSTGHQSRLNRKEVIEKIQFNSQDYSKEELVAEIGATFLCASSGIHPQIIENSTAYIQGWLKKLQDDKKIIVTAAAKAQKAADYILGTAFLQ
jgi:antirestriction protein ArdC